VKSPSTSPFPLAFSLSCFPGLLFSCSRPAPPPTPAFPRLTVGPISFFQGSCFRCHGPYGSFYDDGALERHPGDDLRAVVARMVLGPAQADLPDPDIEALTAYHRSLLDGKPFLAVLEWPTGRGSPAPDAPAPANPSLRGECTPGSFVRLTLGALQLDAAVDGHEWTIALPAGADLSQPFTLTATLDGRTTSLSLPGPPFSHPSSP
jgi:hypothetical protein